MMYTGIVLWTVGEGVLLPMPDIAVHQLAVDNRKGMYFGVAEVAISACSPARAFRN